jgi:hypothetical protein
MAGAAAAADRRECGRPGADLALGAQFALGCLAAPAGPTRDVLFQLAFAAYVGACFNLNPFLGRDGYQILVDALREPNLRRRAREQFARRLARQPDAGDSRLLVRYSVLALAWSVVAVGSPWRPNRHERNSPTSRPRCGAWRRLSRPACRPAKSFCGRP